MTNPTSNVVALPIQRPAPGQLDAFPDPEWERQVDEQACAIAAYEASGELVADALDHASMCDDPDTIAAIVEWYRSSHWHATAVGDIMSGDRTLDGAL